MIFPIKNLKNYMQNQYSLNKKLFLFFSIIFKLLFYLFRYLYTILFICYIRQTIIIR